MLEVENWGEPPQEWLDFALTEWKGSATRRLTSAPSAPESFKERCWQAFQSKGFALKRLRVWINQQVPTDETGYDPGYPHTHDNSGAFTLVHYLQPGDKPAPLDVLQDGEVIQSIIPEVGLTVYIPDGISHGAHRNNGTTNRICLVAMAHP